VTDLADLVWVKFVADANTPPANVQYDGRLVGVPPGVEVPSVGQILGIDGRRRPGTSPITYEWLMTGPIDKVAEFVDTIPGAGGWTVAASRDFWVQAANALLAQGISGSALQTNLPQLYSTAITNDRTANP
jgi:hypothetical protein